MFMAHKEQQQFSKFEFKNTEGSSHPDLYFWGFKK